MKTLGRHPFWGRRSTFVLAATGAAVGLGNVWKFPYIAGENGGGAFVLMYLACIALVGIPIMIAEVMIGRRGRANPITAVSNVSIESGISRGWAIIGWCGVLAGLLILSYYVVIAGWVLEYLKIALSGQFKGLDGAGASELFDSFLADKSRLVQWQTAFMAMTVLVVTLGVIRGLESCLRVMMPLLFLLLLILLGYALLVGDAAAGARFMFGVTLGDLSWRGALIALGHAFFTLSLALGAVMAYGAYMPGKPSIARSVVTVAALDTLVSLVAGMVIFPMVFATPGISPGEGPGLLFVSMPVIFGGMTFGSFFGALFFALVVLAAWSSTISLLEPAVAYLVERWRFHRISASLLMGGAAWVLGLGTVMSFNDWRDNSFLLGMNVFHFLDFLTTNLLLPLGGLLMAIFVGWALQAGAVRHELKAESDRFFYVWRWVLRYIAPLAVLIILVTGVYPVLKTVFAE